MKKIFSIFLFLIYVEAHSKYNSGYNFILAHPITTNSFKGKISTSFNYYIRNYHVRNSYISFQIPFVVKTGISYAALTNHLNQHLNNLYLNTGFCRGFRLSPIIIKPYLTGGYSIFVDKSTHNYGFSMESGAEIYQNKYYNCKIALHFSYRQNFLNQFEYTPNSEIQNGKFGMFKIGASCLF